LDFTTTGGGLPSELALMSKATDFEDADALAAEICVVEIGIVVAFPPLGVATGVATTAEAPDVEGIFATAMAWPELMSVRASNRAILPELLLADRASRRLWSSCKVTTSPSSSINVKLLIVVGTAFARVDDKFAMVARSRCNLYTDPETDTLTVRGDKGVTTGCSLASLAAKEETGATCADVFGSDLDGCGSAVGLEGIEGLIVVVGSEIVGSWIF
jgi:hypothetical protein